MERGEAEAVYDSGREACVEFILGLAGRVEEHEDRLRRLEVQARQDSRTSSKPPSQDPPKTRAERRRGACEGEGVGASGGRAAPGWRSAEQFYNVSPLTFTKLLDDPSNIADALNLYIGGFSQAAKDVIDKFDFGVQIERLNRANLLYQVVGKFAELDLHPDAVSNVEMGYLYEELIRKFSELSNETAGPSCCRAPDGELRSPPRHEHGGHLSPANPGSPVLQT